MDLSKRHCFRLPSCLIMPLHLICYCIVVLQLAQRGTTVNYWRRLGPLSPDLKLGTTCRNSLECLLFVPHSHCDWDKRVCTCQPYHILYNETMCLPASLLGFACSVDEQCTLKVPNAECSDGKCQCKHNHLPLRRDKCIPPAKSGDFCLNDQQCRLGGSHSYCKYIIPRIYGKCRCLQGYYLSRENQCLPTLDQKCLNSEECDKATANSFCAEYLNGEHVCKCRPGFFTSDNGLSCQPIPTTTTTTTTEIPKTTILPEDINNLIEDELQEDEGSRVVNVNAVSLGKPCNHSIECQIRDQYSRCVDGFCECIKPSSTCSSRNTVMVSCGQAVTCHTKRTNDRGCLFYAGCHGDTFQCRNGQCISWYFVCDKNKNCEDGSDESDCLPYQCPQESFQCDSDGTCLSRGSVCNGKWECPDGSDEARCYKGIACDKHAWQCKSGQCLPQYAFCNAVPDCLDGSDEDEEICESSQTCPNGTFTCDNKLCRSTAILCSGMDGCGDNSDEDKCEVCYCDKP